MKSILMCRVAILSASFLTVVSRVSAAGFSTDSSNTIGSNDGAFGTGNALSDKSVGVGEGNTASYGSFAVGYNNETQNGNLAAGGGNVSDANSYYSMLFGEGNILGNSSQSLLSGWGNEMERQYASTMLGQYNEMIFPSGKEGYSNVLVGFSNVIDATGIPGSNIQQTILLGAANTAAETNAYVFGAGNIGQNQTVTLGMWNQTVSNAALIVGNGTNSSARSNGLVVLKNGNTSIQGSLTVGGSPAVTTGYLNSNNYVTKEFGAGADAASNAILAFGPGAEANGDGSVAIGANSEVDSAGYQAIALMGGKAGGINSLATSYALASGHASVAIGGVDYVYEVPNISSGDYAATIGGTANQAIGDNSLASGYWTKTNSAFSVALGSMNLAPAGDPYQWIEDEELFELGNGWAERSGSEPSSGVRSNAITTLKNGNTTVTNKAWKANVAGSGDPLDDPASTTDSGGDALVVEGHARLKGKVIIEEPQGDISMGIYE